MSIKFNYYYGKEAEQFSFFRIPKLLFTDSTFSKLSSDAKVLYGILLDRMNLSMKNGWLDELSFSDSCMIKFFTYKIFGFPSPSLFFSTSPMPFLSSNS